MKLRALLTPMSVVGFPLARAGAQLCSDDVAGRDLPCACGHTVVSNAALRDDSVLDARSGVSSPSPDCRDYPQKQAADRATAPSWAFRTRKPPGAADNVDSVASAAGNVKGGRPQLRSAHFSTSCTRPRSQGSHPKSRMSRQYQNQDLRVPAAWSAHRPSSRQTGA